MITNLRRRAFRMMTGIRMVLRLPLQRDGIPAPRNIGGGQR
jgi:hypothetical protein